MLHVIAFLIVLCIALPLALWLCAKLLPYVLVGLGGIAVVALEQHPEARLVGGLVLTLGLLWVIKRWTWGRRRGQTA